MSADVRALADDAAQIRDTEGDEAYRSADRDRTGDKEHYGQQKESLLKVGKFDISVKMCCKRA